MDVGNKYGMEAMHAALIKMLDEFNIICKQKGIIYSLGFGSMLGAVREHGIIPWDDDIDIIIDRTNYKKLEKVLDASDLFILERNTNKTLWIPRFRYREKEIEHFGYELTIDVFIIDNIPNWKIIANLKLLSVLFLQGMIKSNLSLKKGSLSQKAASVLAYLLGRIIPLSVKFKWLNKISSLANSQATIKCSCYNVEYAYVGLEYNGKLMTEVEEMYFDGILAPVSKYYDSYLTVLYGNYMTPPKQNDRIPKHSSNNVDKKNENT